VKRQQGAVKNGGNGGAFSSGDIYNMEML